MHDLGSLANLESTPQLGISTYSAMRDPGNGERVMQEGERMVTPFRLYCVRYYITMCYCTLCARFSQDDCNVEDSPYLSCINGP